MIAGTCPDAPTRVQTQNFIDGVTYSVQINWDEGAANGFPILGAKIEIQNPNNAGNAGVNDWRDATTLCQQYTNPSLTGWLNSGTRQCTLDLYTLNSGSFAISSGQVINARVMTRNQRCDSLWLQGGGAVMPFLPTIPDAPINPVQIDRGCGTLTFGWNDGLSDGNTPLTSFTCEYWTLGATQSNYLSYTVTRGDINTGN